MKPEFDSIGVGLVSLLHENIPEEVIVPTKIGRAATLFPATGEETVVRQWILVWVNVFSIQELTVPSMAGRSLPPRVLAWGSVP